MNAPASSLPPWPAMSLAQAHALLTAPGARFEMEEVMIHGVRTRCWKNAPPTLRDVLRTGRLFGGRDFIVYENERVTFEAIWRASGTVAHALLAKGLQKGDRVAIAMRNLPEWVAIFYGAALANVLRGVPLQADGYFFLPLWTNWQPGVSPGILDWYTVIGGLVALVALTMHGALWLALKTSGELEKRARKKEK